MYVAVLFLGIQNASGVQPVVFVERTVFYRERAAGMYSALPYAFSQVDFKDHNLFMHVYAYLSLSTLRTIVFAPTTALNVLLTRTYNKTMKSYISVWRFSV